MKHIKQSNNSSAVASAKVGRTIKQFFFSALFAVCAAVPAFATWTYSSNVLSDGDWAISNAVRNTSAGKHYLKISGPIVHQNGSSSTVIDMTGAAAAANVSWIELWASIGSSLGVTKFVGPDVTYLREYTCFSGNTTIEEIELSPDTYCIGHYALRNATALRKLTPTKFPKLTTLGQQAFENVALLEGDFEFPEITSLAASTFLKAQKITSLKFPKLTAATANFTFCGMTSLTNFYAPKAVNLSTIAFYHSNYSGYPCSKLESVTLSGNATQMPQFQYCSSLKSLTPTTFPKITANVSFVGCGKLKCDLSFPAVTTLPQSAFENSGVTSVYLPELKALPSAGFRNCQNLTNLTMKGSASAIGGATITRHPPNFVLNWCSTNVPASFAHAYVMEDGVKVDRMAIHPADSRYPAVFKFQMTADNRAALEALCSTTAANFTDAHRALYNYNSIAKKAIGFVGSPKLQNGVITSVGYVEHKGIFWLVDGTVVPSVQVAIACPGGVRVAKVTSGGFEVFANDDGTYTVETEGGATMDITYAPTAGKLFTDGTTSVTVTNLTPVATIEASVCPKTTVDALARIGDTLYLTLQEAANVGGEVALMTNQTLAAAVTVAADKAVSLDLAGKTLTADGAAFAVAGTLVVTGTGLVETATPFSGEGTVQLMGGTYRIDVGSLCVPGYVATAQGTDPESWSVAPSTDVTTLTLDTATFAAEHIAAVSLTTTAPVACETNGTVISWTIAKNLPFTLVYTVLGSYRFEDRSKTGTVVYQDGIASETAASVADVPVRVYHPTWSWNKSAGTCTDGIWTLSCSKSTALVTVDGVTGIAITGYTSGSGDLDLVTFKDDVGEGLDVIALVGWIFRYQHVATTVCAPAVRSVDAWAFNGNTQLTSVEFSPDLSSLGGNNFSGLTSLETFLPTNLRKLASMEDSFSGCTKLKGDFSLPLVTSLKASSFSGTAVTSLDAPKVATLPGTCFLNCRNLKKLTVKGGSSDIAAQAMNGVGGDCVLDWCSTNVPSGFGSFGDTSCLVSSDNLHPVIFKVRLTEENRAAWEAICTTTAADFTDAHRAISGYPRVAKKAIGFVGWPNLNALGVLSSIGSAKPKGAFWVVDGTPMASVNVTIACPAGVKVAKVTSGGYEVLANDDGSYTVETEGGATMDITYAPTAGKLFTDGTTSVTVTNLTPAATIEASVCPKTTVDALARIGDTLYLTLQDAANVGGEVALMTNQTLAATVTVAADKAVSLDLAGKTLTADGAAFAVAGTLVVTGTGLVETATPFSGEGTVQLMGGTYRVNVGSLCVPGYVATAQGTDPESWSVAPSTDVTTLTLDTVTFAAEHIAAVALVTTAPVLCETNGTVITWTIAKNLPFTLVYTALGSYRFADRTRTGTVAYASGIAGETTVDLASVPTRVYHPTWSWDKSAGTCTDGNWTFSCSKSTGLVIVGDAEGIALTEYKSGCGDLDLLTFKDDVGEGVDVIKLTGCLFRYQPNVVTNVCAPEVRYIDHRVFGSESTYGRPLKTAEFSSALTAIEQYNFECCSKLERFVPTSLPKLTSTVDFSGCTKLTADFSMPRVTTLKAGAFKNTSITSLYAPSAATMPGNCFEGCMSLTNVTIAGGSGTINGLFVTRVPDNFVLNWCSTNVPTGFGHGYTYEGTNRVHRMAIQSENPLSPVILKVKITDANRAAWEAICTKTKKNLTAAHRAISNYPLVRGSKLIGFVGTPQTDKSGNLTTITAVEPKGIFWVVDNRKDPPLMVIVR